MAKKKVVNDESIQDDLYASIAGDTGGDILGELENCKFFVDTGTLCTNYICSGRFLTGGIPGQRITEVYGPSASGKSLIASNVLFGCQKMGGWAIILDCENATNADWMEKASHLNTNRVIRYTPTTLEEAFAKMHGAIKRIRELEVKMKKERKPIVIVYDSISVSPCEREFRETELPENYTASQWKTIVGAKEQPGERAKIINKGLRQLTPILEENDVTVLILNQTRMQIGVMYGSPETTPGGKALEFYASCRLRTSAKKKIENKALKTFSGINMQVENRKNRAFRPFSKHEGIKLYFDTGINPLTGLLSALLEDERVIAVGKGGNYTVAPEYLPEDKTEVKFKSSLERNDVPLQVLLDCPKLIDATSKEEIEQYLAPFQAAIDFTNSGNFVEKIVAFDADGNAMEIEDEEDEINDEE